ADYAGKEFSQFKRNLGDLASSKLSPISLEMNRLMKDEKYLDSIINDGKRRAISVAEPVLAEIYEIIGFYRD
ncbi:MAG: tryptophan--tRNA ligase, partial [Pelagibacteraceae bacterium]|nr:tryptophan--tRNA ligase [Pelagibacteraceae bacterium]